jgi:hypothetical protein
LLSFDSSASASCAIASKRRKTPWAAPAPRRRDPHYYSDQISARPPWRACPAPAAAPRARSCTAARAGRRARRCANGAPAPGKGVDLSALVPSPPPPPTHPPTPISRCPTAARRARRPTGPSTSWCVGRVEMEV